MGDIVFRVPKSVARASQSDRESGSRLPEAVPHNRSALAVDYDREAPPEAPPVPHLIAWPGGQSGVPSSALWQGQDPFAEKRGRASRNTSLVVHVVVIAGVLWWGAVAHNRIIQPIKNEMVFKLFDPQFPPVKPTPKPIQGGGGGGEHRIVAPRKGFVPKPVPHVHMLPPEIARIQRPTITAPPTMHANLQMDSTLPKLGMPRSPQVAVASQGSGSNGFGIGMGGGIGEGQGDGAGAGQGGGYGGGVMNVGGGVSAPQVIHSVEPNFTQQARAANYQGTVSIQLIVDPQGYPQDIHILRHLGMGLDEKAVEAVRQYRFRPAMYKGHPVAVQMIIDVAFHLH